MKKFLRITLKILASIILVIGLFFTFVYFKTNSRINQEFTVQGKQIQISADRAEIAEGKRLYISRGCVDCHGQDGAGVKFLDNPAIGSFTGSNLTKRANGEKISAPDFEKAVRHGVAATGKSLLFMPSTDFAQMSDEETGRLLAYIRSLPAVDKPAPVQKVGPMGRILYFFGKLPLLTSAELIDHQAQSPVKVQPAVSLEYGKYIAMTCTGCHGTSLKGGPIPGAPPEWPAAQDITGKALSKYGQMQFLTAIRTGKRPDGSEIRFPMPWKNFSQMSDTELKALHLYLRGL